MIRAFKHIWVVAALVAGLLLGGTSAALSQPERLSCPPQEQSADRQCRGPVTRQDGPSRVVIELRP